MPDNFELILAVIDPSRSRQWALEKAVQLAGSRDDVQICAFLSVCTDLDMPHRRVAKRMEMQRHRLWLEKQIADIDTSDVDIQTKVVWAENWCGAASLAADDMKADLLIQRAGRKAQGLADSDRKILRYVHSCPVLLVKHAPSDSRSLILAAVKFGAEDDAHKELNNAVIRTAKRIHRLNPKAPLHAVNACKNNADCVDAQEIADAMGVEVGNVCIARGDPENVIADVSQELDPTVVVIGTVQRSGLAAMVIGNTAEKILNRLRSDVLVVSGGLAWT